MPKRIASNFQDFLQQANPFIRHIVLRRRDHLENTIDPETGEPYLQPVGVRLHGDSEDEAITMMFWTASSHRIGSRGLGPDKNVPRVRAP